MGEFIATAFLLIAIARILVFAPISGAHMNPVVSLAAALAGGLNWRLVPIYAAAQITGAIFGTWIAHGMFDWPVLEIGTHLRSGT